MPHHHIGVSNTQEHTQPTPVATERDHLADRGSPGLRQRHRPYAMPGLSHPSRRIRSGVVTELTPDSTRSILMEIGSDARRSRTLPWLFRRR